MSKRRRGSSRAGRPAASQPGIGAERPRPQGVRPKVRARRGQPPARNRSGLFVAILLVAGLGIAALTFVLSNGFGPGAGPSPTGAAGGPSPTTARPRPTGCPTSQPEPLAAGETRTVTITTELGNIVIKVEGALSPIAAGNFVALAECGYYDGVVFHRLMPGFVIQGGDPDGTGSGGPGYAIQDEPITGTYRRGTLAMARTRAPNSQGSQFFIVLDDSAATSLAGASPGYAIFGEVTAGMEVVDQIAAGPNTGGQEGRALEPVAMTSVTVANP